VQQRAASTQPNQRALQGARSLGRRVAHEHQVRRQTAQRAQELTIGRQDQQIATTYGAHQRKRIVSPGVVRQNQARPSGDCYAAHPQRDSKANQCSGGRLGQSLRSDLALERGQRLAQTERGGVER
jgi:hypothetical protein